MLRKIRLVLIIVLLITLSFGITHQYVFAQSVSTITLTAVEDGNQDGTDAVATSKTVWLGTGKNATNSFTGFRFANVQIPQNARITSAKLQVQSSQNQWLQVDMSLYADASAHATALGNLSQKTPTVAKVTHSSNSKWIKATKYSLDDISAVIQELVNKADWKAGNGIVLIAKGTGSAYGRKFITSIEGKSAPQLLISYTTISPTTTPTAVPSSTPTPTSVPMPTPTALPTSTPTPTPMMHHDSERSSAMGQWSPNLKYDTCPSYPEGVTTDEQKSAYSKSVHDTYTVKGPDGKWYPTWHPPVDPTTGCRFGHDHGRNPKTSALWSFIQEQFSFDENKNGTIEQGEREVSGLPFGYVNEQLDVYNMSKGVMDGMRHEDHVGHKIEWENALTLRVNANGGVSGPSNYETYNLDANCDFLMKIHQGTHSKDAFTNNMHELAYFVSCRGQNPAFNGLKVAAAKMVLFGKPGQIAEACNKSKTYDVGTATPPNSPAGDGIRFLPTKYCIDTYGLVPQGTFTDSGLALYEDWVSSNYLSKPDGTVLAYFDPHFAVFTPSRYYDPTKPDNMGRSIDLCYMTEANGDKARMGECDVATNYGQIRDISWDDPRSPFNGVHREMYFNQTWIKNPNGPTTWYTDPFGGNASTTPFTGSVAQYVPQMDNYNKVILESQALGKDRRCGGDCTGVHAPN